MSFAKGFNIAWHLYNCRNSVGRGPPTPASSSQAPAEPDVAGKDTINHVRSISV